MRVEARVRGALRRREQRRVDLKTLLARQPAELGDALVEELLCGDVLVLQ